MTDEQLAALLEMEDLGGMERKMQQQNALASQLRGSALQPSSGKDFGSQLARGLQGGMAGMAMKQAGQGITDYGAAKTKALGNVRNALLRRPDPAMAAPPVVPPATSEELTGF